MIKKTDLKLERDAMDKAVYYISFKYTSLLPFDCYFYFTSNENMFHQENPIKIEKLEKGNEMIFLNKKAILSLSDFNKENCSNDRLFVIIECNCFNQIDYAPECILHTACRILKSQSSKELYLHCEMQKLKVKSCWYVMHNIFGLENENSTNNECEACYTNKKNTVFIPCMHSYACNECAVNVRLRGNKCPLCRQSKLYNKLLGISDIIIINEILNKKRN